MSDPRMEKLNQVCEATRAIGFAIGAMEMLAVVAEGLTEGQQAGIADAVRGLRDIDVLKLACLAEKA